MEERWQRGRARADAEQGKSPVFDRMILVDPYGPDGKPVYKTVEQLVGAR